MTDLIMPSATVLIGDVRSRIAEIPDGSVQCVVTSPPYYGLRSYDGGDAEIGHEQTPQAYVDQMVQVFREVRRVLADDGTLWLNLGDSYNSNTRWSGGGESAQAGNTRAITDSRRAGIIAGIKEKDLIGIPWRVAFALQADGWYLRQDIIWSKPNPMPESVKDRCTKSHEYLFLLTKSPRYYYDAAAITEDAVVARPDHLLRHLAGDVGTLQRKSKGFPGAIDRQSSIGFVRADDPLQRNRRSVWSVATQPYTGAHFAVMPRALVEPCVLAGTREGDTVFDPFTGSGTTLEVAQRLGRKALGIELNAEYLPLIQKRLAQQVLPLEVLS